jgi:NADH-quinone oxidoreductase subunit L
VIKAFEFLAWVMDVVVDKFVQILQWMVCAIVFIVGDGLRSLQVRKVRLQVALSIAGMAIIGIVVYLCGGLS